MRSRDALRLPAVLCGLMLAVGLASSFASGVDGSGLYLDYVAKGCLVTLVALLIFVFVEVVKLARIGADRPLAIVQARLSERWPMLLLPCLIFPLFLAGYTGAKTSIGFLVGFGWERIWADADLLLFGRDPWLITQRLFGTFAAEWWAWAYTFLWGGALLFSMSFVALLAGRRFAATYFSAMMATWLIGGWLMAIAFSAAGPVFAHLADPDLAARFAPLRDSLAAMLAPDNSLSMTQAYLATSLDQLVAVRGGGVSAMPSMHVAACTIYVCAARGTRWLVPAIILWWVIFVGSVHFGYHYAVDGIAAALVAVLCWRAAVAYFRSSAVASTPRQIMAAL